MESGMTAVTRGPRLLGAVALAAAALLAGCSGSGSGASPSTGTATSSAASTPTASSPAKAVPQACTLVTQANAAQLTGDTAVARVDTGSAGTASESLCAYADTSASSVATVTVAFESVPQGLSPALLQAALQQAARNGGAQAQLVSGIGDSAYKEVSTDSAAVVFAKGTIIGVIGVTSKTRSGATIDPDLEALAKQLAAQV